MRELMSDERKLVVGGVDETRLGTITVNGNRAPAKQGGDGAGHSISPKTNIDPTTGFVVLPGGQEGKKDKPGFKSATQKFLDTVTPDEVEVGIPAGVKVRWKRKDFKPGGHQ